MKAKVVLLILISIFTLTAAVWSEGEKLFFLENKYVKVFINAGEEDTGRFAVDVAAGDPARADDDNKPLIYGHPAPWTSYTTLRINGKDFVFGKATSKRPGFGLTGGEILEGPQKENDQIIMRCRYGAIVVDQILDLTRSPSTGLPDTARIKYIIKNEGAESVETGIRTALDTMVGSNDGAPFRLGDQEIASEYEVTGGSFPDFWQAFDSLRQPSVIAQGTLKGGEVTPPDKLLFTNWGKAADHPWEIPFQPGTEFTRLGEEELDSAVVMYWEPRVIQPREERKIVIYYGLGGVTIAPGNTYLGIAAPAETQYTGSNDDSYTIILYMEHRGEASARNVLINLDLPAGLEKVSGEDEIKIPEMIPGVTKQFIWEIKPSGIYFGDANFRIRVTGEGLEPNEVNRRIKLLPPSLIGATMMIPKLKVTANRWTPDPLPINLRLRNLDQIPARDIKAGLICGEGLKLAEGEREERIIADLAGMGETNVSWNVSPLKGAKTGRFKVMVTGTNALPLEIPGSVEIPQLPVALEFSDPGKLEVGQIFCCDLIAYNLDDVLEFIAAVKYDPRQLRLVYVSRGTFLVEDEQLSRWSGGANDYKNGIIQQIGGRRSQGFNGEKTALFRLNFMVVGVGSGTIDLTKIKIFNSRKEEIPYNLQAAKYIIEEAK